MENYRYYFRVDGSDNPMALYAIDQRNILLEWRFDRTTKVWERTDGLMYSLISLDLDYEPTTFNKAIEFEPTFLDQMRSQGLTE
jgi:hypothetical protein